MITTKVLAPIAGMSLAIATMPAVEGLLPVVAFMDAEPVSYVDGDYTAHVRGQKIRDCIFVGDTIAGWYRSDGLWVEAASFSFPDDPALNSRPSGIFDQDFGLWRWHDLPPDATEVRFTVVHNCDGKPKLTTVGPFEIAAL